MGFLSTAEVHYVRLAPEHIWRGYCAMAHVWDDIMKRLLTANPQHFLDWLIPGAQLKSERTIELKSRTLEADKLYNVLVNQLDMIWHVEIQRHSDAQMGRRLWEYNAMATITSGLPVCSFVIYLVHESQIVEPPYSPVLPTGQVAHIFYFTNVKLWEIPTETLKQPGLEGLLPLLTLTREGSRPETIDEMIEGLITSQKTELLSIAYTLASLVFTKEDEREWLIERFAMYQDILQESWVYQEILQEGREQGLQALRQTLMSLMEMRFPALAPLAKQQTSTIKDPSVLQSVIVKLFAVQTAEEAEQYLLTLGNDAKKN